MIQNWELTSRIDPETKVIRYFLLIDGTEQDIRLIARKLKGYVKDIAPSSKMPYTYIVELPNDMDENTQDKLRVAAEEAVVFSQKVDGFVPGGAVGDPLFSTQTSTATPASLRTPLQAQNASKRTPFNLDTASGQELAPETELQQMQVSINDEPENAVAKPIPPDQTSLSTAAREVFGTKREPQTTSFAATNAPQDTAKTADPISISDQDMLLKDMEHSVLGKIPLDDILSAQTRYDMFIDVREAGDKPTPAQQQTDQRKQEAFNVFEPEKNEPDPLDVEEIHTITDKLTKKDMDFINKPNIPEEKAQPSSAFQPKTDVQPAMVPPAHPEPAHTGSTQSALDPQAKSSQKPQKEPSENNLHREDLPDITVRGLSPTPESEPLSAAESTDALPQQPIKTVLHLRLRKPDTPAAPQDPGKTMLRLRRKATPPSQNTLFKPLHSTVSQSKQTNAKEAKSKVIDHSIEIPISELKKHNWSLEVPLVPTYTLNNMVMSVNRFSHATAVSVMENPGTMYNPFVLHGTTGTGKTHFLNALAFAFSKKFGQEHIFMTNGVRLSRGIQRYMMEGNIAKFEKFMESVQVLLIDDIHLLAINEQNREFLSKLLNSFVRDRKQIVITSKYPPESLAKLEELIKFRLDAGWISELKPATGATHFRIVKKMLLESGIDLNDKQIEEFFGGNHMTLGTVTRSIRRLKVLENLLSQNVTQKPLSQAEIFEKLLATKGEDSASELVNKDPAEITTFTFSGNGEWGRIGVFYPQNCSNMMNWIVYALDQRAKELGISGGFEIVVRSSYSTENIISSAFKIANLCDNKKLKGAIILGPQPNTCDPSVRENFYDILTHMLEIMLIRCGIINYENVRLPSTYVKLISELMR